MPTYVYRFVDTGETIEVQQAFTDDALTEARHPASGELLPVKKVFTPVGVTFKGGGFYKTDSRGSSSRTASTPASTSSDGGSSSDDRAASPSKKESSGANGSSSSTSSSTTAPAPST